MAIFTILRMVGNLVFYGYYRDFCHTRFTMHVEICGTLTVAIIPTLWTAILFCYLCYIQLSSTREKRHLDNPWWH